MVLPPSRGVKLGWLELAGWVWVPSALAASALGCACAWSCLHLLIHWAKRVKYSQRLRLNHYYQQWLLPARVSWSRGNSGPSPQVSWLSFLRNTTQCTSTASSSNTFQSTDTYIYVPFLLLLLLLLLEQLCTGVH